MTTFKIIFYGAIIALVVQGCDLRDSPLDKTHSVTIRNFSDCDLAIVMDEIECIYLIGYGSEGAFSEVSEGYHLLSAYVYQSQAFGKEIDQITIFVSREKDYRWDIQNCQE